MTFIKVPMNGTHVFEEFIDKSVFTFEGIALPESKFELHKEGVKLEKVLRNAGFTEKECIGYVYKGKHMNEAFRLTGDNAYPENLTFLSIPEFYNPVFKVAVGARWFDDIVANNSIRQNAQEFGTNADIKSHNM